MKTEIILAERQQVEQALGESEQRYRRLLAATTDYIYTVNVENGRSGATLHGPGCAAVTGYTSAEFAADPYLWYRVVHEEDRDAVVAQAARILAGEAPPPLEHRLIHKQGGVRWIRNTPIPHRDAQGRLMAYDGLITDITSRKRAEMFVAAEHAVTAILAAAPAMDAAWFSMLQSLGTILLLHFAAGWKWDGVTSPLRRVAVWSRPPLQSEAVLTADCCRTTAPASCLRARVAAQGEAAWISDAAALRASMPLFPDYVPLHGGCIIPVRADGQVVGLIEVWSREVFAPDPQMQQVFVTVGAQLGQFIERQRALGSLEHERHLLRTVVDNLPDCIFVKDTASRFLMTNAAHIRLLGATGSEDTLGKTDDDFFPKELAAQYRADEENVVRTGQALCEREEPVVDRNGRRYWFLTTKVPLKDGDGRTIGLVGIARDITERKQAASQLERAYARLARRDAILKTMVRRLKASHKELEQTQKQLIQAAKLESVGTLAAGVAHEVKNPLQTILLGIHFLAQKFSGENPDVARTLADMRDAVSRANVIIRELLALSAATDFHRAPGNLNAVIERALLLMQNEFIAARIEVIRQLAPSLPPVLMDAEKLEQVFINFFINATQAMPAGGALTLATRSLRLDREASARSLLFGRFRPGDCVVIAEVSDTGTGIAEADLPRVFDPFFTTKPVGVGTGLGLSVARKIVELHAGAVEIVNVPAGGARVTVVLKAQDAVVP